MPAPAYKPRNLENGGRKTTRPAGAIGKIWSQIERKKGKERRQPPEKKGEMKRGTEGERVEQLRMGDVAQW